MVFVTYVSQLHAGCPLLLLKFISMISVQPKELESACKDLKSVVDRLMSITLCLGTTVEAEVIKAKSVFGLASPSVLELK